MAEGRFGEDHAIRPSPPNVPPLLVSVLALPRVLRVYPRIVPHERVSSCSPSLKPKVQGRALNQYIVVHVEHAFRPQAFQRSEPVVYGVVRVHVEDDGQSRQLGKVPRGLPALGPRDPDGVHSLATRVVFYRLHQPLWPLERVHDNRVPLLCHLVPARRSFAVPRVHVRYPPEERRREEQQSHQHHHQGHDTRSLPAPSDPPALP
mmetsp:Transcript_9603/g.27401  ORF Transcript_9603/g.27401 Transcript_9603/m.27401 type:complete len:205 (-) Transcript_9603:139-753(-)